MASTWQRIFFSRWFLAGTIIVLALLVLAYTRTLYRDYQVRQEIERLEDEVEQLEAKKIKTLEILKYVQSPAFVEERARLELNLLKPGEKLMVIEGASTTGQGRQVIPPVVQQNTTKASNPLKWWWYFFDPSRLKIGADK